MSIIEKIKKLLINIKCKSKCVMKCCNQDLTE